MDRHAGQQQGRRVKVPQIMQPGMWEHFASADRSHGGVMRLDQVRNQRGHRVRVNGAAPAGGKYVLVAVRPSQASRQAFFRLTGAVLA